MPRGLPRGFLLRFYQAFQDVVWNEKDQEEFCNSVKPKLTAIFTWDCFKIIPCLCRPAGGMTIMFYRRTQVKLTGNIIYKD